MTRNRHEIEIIGWHDGITEALVRVEDERWMYASMIAWSPEQELRIFGLVEMDPTTLGEIQALAAAAGEGGQDREATWARLRDRIAKFLGGVRGPVDLWLCDELDGERKGTVRVASRDVVAMMGRDVEDALDGARFSMLAARLSP